MIGHELVQRGEQCVGLPVALLRQDRYQRSQRIEARVRRPGSCPGAARLVLRLLDEEELRQRRHIGQRLDALLIKRRTG